MNLVPLPAFDDNYIWLLETGQRAIVVDPGDASVVINALATRGLTLEAILITHHHPDHTGGLVQLQTTYRVPVYAPEGEAIPGELRRLADGDTVVVLGLAFEVIKVAGHTAGHIAYYLPAAPGRAPVLFCGDTLFSGGCGRLFEGTPAQMLASLDRLSALPDDTQVVCTHEYTLSNLRFANAVEPSNQALQSYTLHCQHLREQGLPTLPAHLATERQINPFLRSRLATIRQALQQHSGGQRLGSDADYFGALREWKNNFR